MFKKTSLLIIVILLKFTDIDAKKPKNNGTEASLAAVNRLGYFGQLVLEAHNKVKGGKHRGYLMRRKKSKVTRAANMKYNQDKAAQQKRNLAENKRYEALPFWKKLLSCCMRRRTK
jgi:hypothetical protein